MGNCCGQDHDDHVMYHGCHSAARIRGNYVQPHSVIAGQRAIVATTHRELALVFTAQWSDQDIGLSYFRGRYALAEKKPDMFHQVFHGQTGCMYQVSGKGFHHDERVSLPHQYFRMTRTRILARETISDVWAELEKASSTGKLKLFRFSQLDEFNKEREAMLDA